LPAEHKQRRQDDIPASRVADAKAPKTPPATTNLSSRIKTGQRQQQKECLCKWQGKEVTGGKCSQIEYRPICARTVRAKQRGGFVQQEQRCKQKEVG